jgi:hypothetical protein
MPQGIFAPARVRERLHTGRPEVGTEADRRQVSEIGKVSEGQRVREGDTRAGCGLTARCPRGS